MARQKVRFPMTSALREFFQAIGKTGGWRAAAKMTPTARAERAKKAAAARWGKRKKG
jgi:hypothetical protein